jgi:hypothetical protein
VGREAGQFLGLDSGIDLSEALIDGIDRSGTVWVAARTSGVFWIPFDGTEGSRNLVRIPECRTWKGAFSSFSGAPGQSTNPGGRALRAGREKLDTAISDKAALN